MIHLFNFNVKDVNKVLNSMNLGFIANLSKFWNKFEIQDCFNRKV